MVYVCNECKAQFHLQHGISRTQRTRQFASGDRIRLEEDGVIMHRHKDWKPCGVMLRYTAAEWRIKREATDGKL